MPQKQKLFLLIVLPPLILLLLFVCLFWRPIQAAISVKQLDAGFYSMKYTGSYGLENFLEQGGAATDFAVADFVIQRMFHGMVDLNLQGSSFGCSTLSVASPGGEQLFGRNFDWGACTAMVVQTNPPDGYASVSTVNMDFLDLGLDLSENAFVRLMSAASPYAPMDGMNEQGLCVAVLMIEDSPAFGQDTGKPDLTTTTAVRLLLDKAATVDEAVTLLQQYDMHASMGMMVHFALADAQGKSVVVEYVNNEMTVIETPVVTNFYLAEGEKNGIGTTQSHTRYNILLERLAAVPAMDEVAVRDAIQSVSKQNFGEFESTEWSIVYDQSRGLAHYYHRENYDKVYTLSVK